ncbi:MAG: PIN domain-containing protein [Planctomycetes bacterium]|nr:PIN domain-containing protein [Planctomycetota bacterium]
MTPRLLLDTNTVIHFLKGHAAVQARWLATSPSLVHLSAVSLYELLVGATTSTRPDLRRTQVETLVRAITVLPFGPAEAEAAARIRGQLQPQGRLIGPLDTLIAATALAHDLTVATANLGEFARVPGLRVVDWTASGT